MLGYVSKSSHIILKFLSFLIEDKERPAKTKFLFLFGKTLSRISQFWIWGHLNIWLRAVLTCTESDSAQANIAQSHWFCKYLRENKFFSKTILACISGAQKASIHEMKKWQNSRDTAPLLCRQIVCIVNNLE